MIDEVAEAKRSRERYATAALQGMMAGCPWSAEDLQDPTIRPTLKRVADLCFIAADEMIERSKNG